MKYLLLSVVLILITCIRSQSQTLYAPNERVIIVNDPARRAEYVAQAQKVLEPSDKLTIIQSKNNPSLVFIRATNVARLDNPSKKMSQIGKAFPNWIEKKRSRQPDTMYCTPCGRSVSSTQRQSKGIRDQTWRFTKSRRTVVADTTTCCPKANNEGTQRVAVILVKGADKVTIAELLEEASRLTSGRGVDVVRFVSIFPPGAAPLLSAFNQQLTKRTRAILRPTTSLMSR